MEIKLFEKLFESMVHMNEIIDAERVPSREFVVDALQVKEIRKKTGLTQEKLCHLIDVNIGTLRNWEQGRREPTGPAKALLRAIYNDPKHVLAALASLAPNTSFVEILVRQLHSRNLLFL